MIKKEIYKVKAKISNCLEFEFGLAKPFLKLTEYVIVGAAPPIKAGTWNISLLSHMSVSAKAKVLGHSISFITEPFKRSCM